jgi:hypothetical protein
MEPEPQSELDQAEGIPPPEEMGLAEFLKSCAEGSDDEEAAPQHCVEMQAEEFGSAVRAGFASLWAAVTDGSALTAGCDVVAAAGDQSYSCHSLVLTVWSPVLRTSLEERWSSSSASAGGAPSVLTIELGPAEPADFKTLLCYCYTGELILRPTNVIGLLHLSDFYGVEAVKAGCGEFLFELLGNEQLPALLTIAEQYNVARLRHVCACALADYFEDLLEDGTLWSLSAGVWQELLARTSLAVSDETTVLDAVLEFASPPHVDGAAARAARLEHLLPYVRWPQLGERLITVQEDPELMVRPRINIKTPSLLNQCAIFF